MKSIFNYQILKKIQESLIGNRKKIGRSSTAQYGLVEIRLLHEENAEWHTVEDKTVTEGTTVFIYADARLIFLDKYGVPTFTPKPEDFKLNGSINWKKSQIRTFQYAPWNFKRQARDADRCGIEKGSVIVIDNAVLQKDFKEYVGLYQNEGFGKIILNPDFLRQRDSKPDEKMVNGLALYQLKKTEDAGEQKTEEEKRVETTGLKREHRKPVEVEIEMLKKEKGLLFFLGVQKEQEMINNLVYETVNLFIANNTERFTRENKERFASQWGTIRDLATKNSSLGALKGVLFGSKDGYLSHGVAKEKWELNDRLNNFIKFVDKLDANNVQLAIINLATQMAKICGGQTNE